MGWIRDFSCRWLGRLSISALAICAFAPDFANAQLPPWSNLGGNPQHTGISSVKAILPKRIVWSTPVDIRPPYSGNDLFIHYGTPVIASGPTSAGTIIVPVKIGSTDQFRVDAYRGSDGLLIWSFRTDYTLATGANWIPSCGISLTKTNQVIIPGSGGTVYIRPNATSPTATTSQVSFYGLDVYKANKLWADNFVQICTPITSDNLGNIWFGFRVTATAPASMAQIRSGIAHIAPNGTATWRAAYDIAGGQQGINTVTMNCAPALSNDGKTLYVGIRKTTSSIGALAAVDAQTLTTRGLTILQDPRNGNFAYVSDDGTASPTVAPDGDVYYGILENPFPGNHARGFMLHFDKNANQRTSLAPGAFGWDDTPSIVPASMVPGYRGTSRYLLFTKYNNYAGAGGDGVNKLAILDPFASQFDSISGINVMKEVRTVAGITPDSTFDSATFPNAVREWCINSAAVDPAGRCLIAGSEDGYIYRWDLVTNKLTGVQLTGGVGEAYTPALIGPSGLILGINGAKLFIVSN